MTKLTWYVNSSGDECEVRSFYFYVHSNLSHFLNLVRNAHCPKGCLGDCIQEICMYW